MCLWFLWIVQPLVISWAWKSTTYISKYDHCISKDCKEHFKFKICSNSFQTEISKTKKLKTETYIKRKDDCCERIFIPITITR